MDPLLRECPRCYARVSLDRMDQHIDWHRGVHDGFHKFIDSTWHGPDGVHLCRGVPNRPHWVGEEHCMLPADHPYHQPLPEVQA